MTVLALSNKFFILCLYMKTFCVNQMKGHFDHFVQLDQHGKIPKCLTKCKTLFLGNVFIAVAVVPS